MKLDVIYPYLRNYSRELEWSIKSLKNTEHGQVYVIGQAPDYPIDAKVITPQVPPMWARISPYNDVLNKLLIACRDETITDDFYLFNDDFFLLAPYDGTIYDRGDLKTHIEQRKHNDSYTQMLQRTVDWLEREGYSTKDYTTHTPIIYNKQKLEELILRIMPIVSQGNDMSIRSLYGNVYNVKSEYMAIDTKNPKNYQRRTILSTTETSFNGEIGVYIRKRLGEV